MTVHNKNAEYCYCCSVVCLCVCPLFMSRLPGDLKKPDRTLRRQMHWGRVRMRGYPLHSQLGSLGKHRSSPIDVWGRVPTMSLSCLSDVKMNSGLNTGLSPVQFWVKLSHTGLWKVVTLCSVMRCLWYNGWTVWDAVWDVDSEAQETMY